MTAFRRTTAAIMSAILMLAASLPLSAVVAATEATSRANGCEPTVDRSVSVARLWDEAVLAAIRRDFPAPTVHARNLHHVSAAMWDAWSAFDADADAVFHSEKLERDNVISARRKAISYAAYRVASHRYAKAEGATASLARFDELMASLCYPVHRTKVEGDSASALGNRIAATIIEAGLHDGARERQGYTSPDYMPVNEPMIVALPGTTLNDPDRWQPLALKVAISQNGQPLPVGPQEFVGPHWGHVASFALPEQAAGVPIDPGSPPLVSDAATLAEFGAKAVEVVGFSSLLDPGDGVIVDVGPAAIGANTLGTDDGSGYLLNPTTGEPYAANLVPRADFGRVVAEFWADGPDSETPPGHWNTLANTVTGSADFERRIGGVGSELDPLEWDVKLYLALNGALHDAAVAAWGAKGYYDYVRPISMIRWMGGLGQSSDIAETSYHRQGLPLEPGLVEIVTLGSSSPGERHEHLAEYIGEIAVRAWQGAPDEPETQTGGVGWIRAVEWVPYQLPTFVTPAFAGYVSGHSTFSRAAAEVLTAITGSEFFPGGLGSWPIPAGSLEFEAGPSEVVELQWATYFDAADQAGRSRLYGGIHVEVDDLRGRTMGAECGRAAWALAMRHYEGSVRI